MLIRYNKSKHETSEDLIEGSPGINKKNLFPIKEYSLQVFSLQLLKPTFREILPASSGFKGSNVIYFLPLSFFSSRW